MPIGNSAQNRPQARDDFGATAEEVSLFIDVLANDGRSPALQIWSLDQADPTHPSSFVELPGGSTVGEFDNGQLLYKTNNKFDYLAEGETAYDSFTYSVRLANGEISVATVNVLVTGVDDPTRIESVSVKLTEGDSASDISTSGQLVITDPDSPATVVARTQQGNYGLFTIEADGSWTYEADGPHDEFTEGKSYFEIFRVNSSDGKAKATVIIDIMGTADDDPGAAGAMFGGGSEMLSASNPDFVAFA